MTIPWLDINDTPSCPQNLIEACISFGVMMSMFLFGFGFSVKSIISLHGSDNIKTHCVFKCTYMVDILIFWIVFVLYLYTYYYCYEFNVLSIQHNINPFYVIIVESIAMGLLVIQLLIIQINTLERRYYYFSMINNSLKKEDIVISLAFHIVSIILLEVSVLIFYVSHLEGYTNFNKSLIITIPLAILFGIISHFIMLYTTFKNLYSIIKFIKYNDKKMDKIYSSSKGFDKDKLHIKTASITPFPTYNNNNNNTESLTSHHKKSNTLLGHTPEPPTDLININSVKSTESINTTSNNQTHRESQDIDITYSIQLDYVVKNISKIITITMFSYIIIIIPIIFGILSGFIKNNNSILSLITGYIFIICSVLSILYLYLHYSFDEWLYYKKMICCVKMDNILIRKMNKMAEDTIYENSKSGMFYPLNNSTA